MTARISTRAQGDLDCIYALFTLQQGFKAAERFLEQARQAVQFLADNPQAGPHPRWARRHKDLHFWVISRTNFLIYYRLEPQGVSIERVLDGRRDVARIIEQGLEDPIDVDEGEPSP